MLYRIAALVAASLLACAPAAAQLDTRTIPAASTLTGAERMPAVQGSGCTSKTAPCASVAITPAQIGTFIGRDANGTLTVPSIVATNQQGARAANAAPSFTLFNADQSTRLGYLAHSGTGGSLTLGNDQGGAVVLATGGTNALTAGPAGVAVSGLLSVTGTASVQTPNAGTSGGLVVRSNATSGLAYVQFVNSNVTAQLGYMQVNAAGLLTYGGPLAVTRLNLSALPTYASDSAAGTGGLAAGDVYKTSTGELRIKL